MAQVMLVGLSASETRKYKNIFLSVHVSCEVLPKIDTALEKIPTAPPALVITHKPLDIRPLQGLNEVLRTHAPVAPFLVLLKNSTAQEALQSMKAGAYECLTQDMDRYRILAAAKRATSRLGRTLFVDKVVPRKSPVTVFSVSVMLFCLALWGFIHVYNGPPSQVMLLGSANLSGIQWSNRDLWVGDWFDSTITQYELKKSFIKGYRVLISKNIFKMQDGQPILVANSPDAIYTISSDLKIRAHQKSVGLPTIQTKQLSIANPTGLAWDGNFIWSSDGQTNLLYKHGEDLRVLETVRSILAPVQGLTYDGKAFWIIGGSPLKLARLEITKKGREWDGPYAIDQVLAEGVMPTGVSVGFDRVWLVSGGDPKMMSKKLSDVTRHLTGWGADAPKKL